MVDWTEDLPRGVCHEARAWCRTQPSLEAAWAACERGDWMLWLAGRYAGPPWSDGRRRLVLAACECARLALPHVPAGETRPLRAIEAAERWARGEATEAEVREAADDAYVAAVAADGAAAASAPYADAAADAYDAAYAAASAPYDADDAADDAADRSVALRECADIVRRHYPTPPRQRLYMTDQRNPRREPQEARHDA